MSDRTTIHLSDAAAHALGALLAGRYELTPTLPTRADRVLGGLTFDWVHVPRSGRAADKSIGELEVRKRTGVTIVAILRGSVPIVAPEPNDKARSGRRHRDRLPAGRPRRGTRLLGRRVMHNELLILGVAFLIAGLVARAGNRIGLPTIPLFIAAGIVLGPNTPGRC